VKRWTKPFRLHEGGASAGSLGERPCSKDQGFQGVHFLIVKKSTSLAGIKLTIVNTWGETIFTVVKKRGTENGGGKKLLRGIKKIFWALRLALFWGMQKNTVRGRRLSVSENPLVIGDSSSSDFLAGSCVCCKLRGGGGVYPCKQSSREWGGKVKMRVVSGGLKLYCETWSILQESQEHCGTQSNEIMLVAGAIRSLFVARRGDDGRIVCREGGPEQCHFEEK